MHCVSSVVLVFFSFCSLEGPATGCGGGLLLLTFFAVLSFFLFFLFWRFSCASRLYGGDVKIALLLFLDLFVRFCVGREHYTIIARMSVGSELPRRIGGVLTCIVSTSGTALSTSAKSLLETGRTEIREVPTSLKGTCEVTICVTVT